MSYTLTIVDMQRKFPAANKRSLIQTVADEIITCIQQRGSIIFVEFLGYGPTHHRLVALTDRYRNTFQVRKMSDGGSEEVIKCMRAHDLPMGRIRGVGVNTDQCVWHTLSKLMKDHLPYAQLEIVKKGCNSYSRGAHKEGIGLFTNLNNTIIV